MRTVPVEITLSSRLARRLDQAALSQNRTRDQLIRRAIEEHLDDLEDLAAALRALGDENDEALDWSTVRRSLIEPS